MTDAAVDWSSLLSDLGVPGVPGVPAQKSATFSGTPSETPGVLGVPAMGLEHLGTPSEHLIVPDKLLNNNKEHLGTPGTPDFTGGRLCDRIGVGLEKLHTMRVPRIQRPELWPAIVTQAFQIATDGWAAQALALGWEPLHLFGYQPSDDPDEFSLAVELEGRAILAVDERRFYLRQDNVRSFYERRHRPLLTRYLWDFDR